MPRGRRHGGYWRRMEYLRLARDPGAGKSGARSNRSVASRFFELRQLGLFTLIRVSKAARRGVAERKLWWTLSRQVAELRNSNASLLWVLRVSVLPVQIPRYARPLRDPHPRRVPAPICADNRDPDSAIARRRR